MNNPSDFCYWCQGFFEIQKPNQINSLQLQEIKNHLDLVLYGRASQIEGKNTLTSLSGELSPVLLRGNTPLC